MAIYSQAFETRPKSVTLVLASTAQSSELGQLLMALSADFNGCLLISLNGVASTQHRLQIQTQLNNKFRSTLAAKSLSLLAGQIIWLDPKKSYQLNAREQLLELADVGDKKLIELIGSLGEQFGARACLIPMDVNDQELLLDAASALVQRRGTILLAKGLLSKGLLSKGLEQTNANFTTLIHNCAVTSNYLTPLELAEKLQQQLTHQRAAVAAKPLIERKTFERIFELLSRLKQTDFNRYREPSLITRLEQRLQQIGETDIESYYQRLQSDNDELNRLYNELLIGTTSFFRQPAAFDDLYLILHKYLESGADSLKIWSAGCSTGEEAYSIALLADRLMDELKRPVKVTIYATDLDRYALERAREGLYTSKAIEDIPQRYLPKNINRVGAKYDVGGAIRSSILFNHHDLLDYRPLKEMDLIVCRNLLIYFKTDTQDALIKQFHTILKPGGFLMLGRSESTGTSRSLFVPAAQSSRIYKALSFKPLDQR